MTWLIERSPDSQFDYVLYVCTASEEWVPHTRMLTHLFRVTRSPYWRVLAWGSFASDHPRLHYVGDDVSADMYMWLQPSAIASLSEENWLRMGPDFARKYFTDHIAYLPQAWQCGEEDQFRPRFEKTWGPL